MTTKERLKSYRACKDFVKHFNSRRADLATMGLGPTPEDEDAAKRFALEAWNIEAAIARMADPTEQLLIHLRYIKGCSWTKVSLAIHYSKAQTFRIHARALEHLDDLLTK